MELRIINKETYLSLAYTLPDDRLKDIDLNQYSDYYFLLYHNRSRLAICGIHEQKNTIRQVNGLIALEKGYGKKLLLMLPYNYIRLNCTKQLYDNYYSKLGFNKYLELDNYIECISIKK